MEELQKLYGNCSVKQLHAVQSVIVPVNTHSLDLFFYQVPNA